MVCQCGVRFVSGRITRLVHPSIDQPATRLTYHAILLLQPVLHHLKLQLAHGREDGAVLGLVVALVEQLHGALLQELVDALAEVLVLPCSADG